jgi:hypothetical protein
MKNAVKMAERLPLELTCYAHGAAASTFWMITVEAQMKVKAKSVKGVTASATDRGTIILSIQGAVKIDRFALPAHKVSEVVACLIAAHSTSSQKEGRLPDAIVAQMTVVTISEHEKRVTLSLMPTEDLLIPFSMTPSLASKTSESLAKAVATLEPRPTRKPH